MTLPNILSLFRLSLAPVFPLVYFSGVPNAHFVAAAIYVTAAATDILDGYLARRLNKITRLGRLLDPLADKLMGAVVIVCLAVSNPFLWWAAMLFLLKEALMGVGALVQYQKIDDVPPSVFLGKFAVTFFFLACLIMILARDAISPPVKQGLMAAAMIFSLSALVLYLQRFIKYMKKKGG